MKRIIFTLICALSLANVSAQTAKEILDKAASVVNAKKGATADFVMSGKYGNAAGTISIKGNKFVANTPQAKMWYDGKTQWTYMTSTEEVNVSTPTEAQQQTMNPYRFINLYNMGYAMSSYWLLLASLDEAAICSIYQSDSGDCILPQLACQTSPLLH